MTTVSNISITLALVGLLTCGGCQSFTSSTAQGASTSTGNTGTPSSHRGPEVEVVRNGVLAGYDSTTVGKAFEGTFQNAKWSSFETPKGATVVEFDGTILYKVVTDAGFHPYKRAAETDFRDAYLSACKQKAGDEDAVESCLEGTQLPVTFQFLLTADKQNFSIAYVDPNPFSPEDNPSSMIRFNLSKVMAFIYR